VSNTAKEQVVWSLDGNSAELTCGHLSGCIDTARPNAGLRNIAIASVQHATKLLRVYRADGTDEKSWPLPLAETYVRGNDLVASYKPTEDWPFSPQLYWQANSLRAIDGVLASVSLLVSVQTHLLDTCPQIGVASQLPGGEAFVVSTSGNSCHRVERFDRSQNIRSTNEDCCVLSRFPDTAISYIEIMPAGDFQKVDLHPEATGAALEWRLFVEFLEKGVIRRARVHTAVLPRQNDIELAAACCGAIDRLELPLTT
jgi:hypothetical protein